ncbi:PEPxxWA-CTERM sorting domain-containing protein [Glacieibacterium frigidum]|nr:PEPxxWA-CTERM sorting domain-containing protein [Glacieibacterium frigidum]
MTKLGVLVAAALAFTATGASAATVITLSNPTPANQFLDLDLGINFTVNSAVTVNSLGAFTNGSSPITVTLYRLTSTSTGTAVASASVTGLPDVGSNYAFTSIGPVLLTAGLYQINARYNNPANGNYNPNSGNTATVLFNTLGGALSFSGSYYNFPGTDGIASTLDTVSQLSYGAGTFAVVPEPATWGLLIAGFVMVGVAARRRAVLTA